MQQIKKKLYAAPRVKSVKFQVENGYEMSCRTDDCTGQQMKSLLENYRLDDVTENTFGDMITSNSGSTTGN